MEAFRLLCAKHMESVGDGVRPKDKSICVIEAHRCWEMLLDQCNRGGAKAMGTYAAVSWSTMVSAVSR